MIALGCLYFASQTCLTTKYRPNHKNVHWSVIKSVLTKLVASIREPLCRTLQWGGTGLQQNSLWTNSRPPEGAGHALWSSCSQHSASVPVNKHRYKMSTVKENNTSEGMTGICLDEGGLSILGDTPLLPADPSCLFSRCEMLLIGSKGTWLHSRWQPQVRYLKNLTHIYILIFRQPLHSHQNRIVLRLQVEICPFQYIFWYHSDTCPQFLHYISTLTWTKNPPKFLWIIVNRVFTVNYEQVTISVTPAYSCTHKIIITTNIPGVPFAQQQEPCWMLLSSTEGPN